MKTMLALLLFALPLLAQEPQEISTGLQKARELERRAGKMLEQGRRAEAFELLAQAADLRERDRNQAERKKTEKKKAKAPDVVERRPKLSPLPLSKAAMQALKRMQMALMGNQMKRAHGAGMEAHRFLTAWAKSLQGKRKAPTDVHAGLRKRVEGLEKQVVELRKMLDNSK